MTDVTIENVRENIVNILRETDALVTFTKVDGTERKMRCTLREGVAEPTLGTSTRPTNQEIVNAWDLDNGGWRSFRVANVKNIEIV
jgi:hypothetical protein